MSIEVQNVSKYYGSQKALDAVSFKVSKGEIVGFLGPNGAGKSTLMKILTTYINADQGHAKVNGFDVKANPMAVQKVVGYLPEHNPLYLDLYVKEYLAFNAGVYKVDLLRIDEVLALTGLSGEAHKKIGQLSKGYRQRVGLATALLHSPEVLILDEPTTGLDPNQLVEIRDLIKNIGKDKTVFLSTHIMKEVEAICDRVIIINKGRIVADNLIENLVQEVTQQTVEVAFDIEITAKELFEISNLTQCEQDGACWVLTFSTKEDMRAVIFDFAQVRGYKILQLTQRNKDLESVFREKTR